MMEDETIAARLRFHGITVEVGVLLREHKSYIMSVLPDGLDAFYDHAHVRDERGGELLIRQTYHPEKRRDF